MAVFLDPEIQQQLKDKLLSLRDLFDELFSDISPTRISPTTLIDDRSNNIAIQRNILTDSQCLRVEHLAGFISSAIKYFEDFDIKQLNEVHKILVTCSEYDTVSRLTAAKRRSDRTISLLHDYLKNEINRSEDLANRVKELEMDQVNKTDELLRVRKELQKTKAALPNKTIQKLNPIGSEDTTDDAKALTDDDDAFNLDPHSLNGRFIRKKFDDKYYFGLIVNFQAPYYMVVYEDSDFEDMSRKQVQSLLWAHDVPAITEINCKKHAKKLKIPATNAYATGIATDGLKEERSASSNLPIAIDLTDSGDNEIDSKNGDAMVQGSSYGLASTSWKGDFDTNITKANAEESDILTARLAPAVAVTNVLVANPPTTISALSIPNLKGPKPKSATPMSCPSADMKVQKRQSIISVVAQIARDKNTLPTACQDKMSSSPSNTTVQRKQPDDDTSRQGSIPSFNNSTNHLSESSTSSSAPSFIRTETGDHNLTTSSTSVQSLKRKREESSIQNSSRFPTGESRRDSNPTSNSGCVIIDMTDD